MSKRINELASMTGYGRSEDSFDGWRWVWEVRSVNGKNLDMRLRLPPGFESLEPTIRKRISSQLTRGNLQISLNIQSDTAASGCSINESWLNALIDHGEPLVSSKKIAPARLDGLYMVRGVIADDLPSASDPVFKQRNAAILESLNEMIGSLKQARAEEGEALGQLLKSCINNFSNLTERARSCAGAQPEQLKRNYAEKFTELLGENLPEDRLITEAALLAVKADVREELDRLDAHLAQAQNLLGTGGPVGRKLDFLSQEFIREINTLCSKSTDIELTQIGLEMKSLIEQFREQAANVE